MRRTFFTLSVGLAMVAGCSPARQGATGAGPSSASNVLTRAEIEASPHMRSNAFEAIEKLRPGFFRARATSGGGRTTMATARPVLYIDGQRRESLEYLKVIPSAEIAEIRFLSVQDATQKYGWNVPAGVLDVSTIRR